MTGYRKYLAGRMALCVLNSGKRVTGFEKSLTVWLRSSLAL